MPVQAADRSYVPPELEKRIQALWRDRDARKATRAARARGKRFAFIDGPPYTSGHIHLGTAWNKTLKDCELRFQTMQGKLVRDQPGYDMHGLPIEVKVEQALGIRNKKEIEALGVEKFVAECRRFSTDFLDVMNGEFSALGVWLDWDRPYMTIANDYIEGAWWAVKRAHERGLLYRSQR
ncbi:MAG: class I tRNA ligase family protein, partial [Methanobacteriota archaeon]